MKNILLRGLFLLTSTIFITSSASALTCTNLTKALSKGSENSEVLKLQQFLFDSGYLTVKPNGYFGVGTFAAVKSYQKSAGLSQVGVAGPATRATIKKESCITTGVTSVKPSTPMAPSSEKKEVVEEVVKVAVPKPKTPVEERNSKRVVGVETILNTLYKEFTTSRGIMPIPVLASPLELCILPPPILGSNGLVATSSVVVSCKDFIDTTKLDSFHFENIPRDPALATSSIMLGYTVTRSSFNDVSVIAKNAEGGITIKATCNFNNSCKDVKLISSVFYDVPSVASTSRAVLVKDSSLVVPFVIYGKNFTTTKNTVVITSSFSDKKYTLGDFPSVDGTSISLQSKDLNRSFSCGSSCSEKVPSGEYDITLSNNGGISNGAHISLKEYTTSIVDNNNSAKPNTKNTKVASFLIGVGIPVTIKSITLTATNTPSVLLSKITHLTIQDADTGKMVGSGSGGGGTVALTNQLLPMNTIKKYDVYVDVDTMAFNQVGNVTYTGYFTVTDSLINTSLSADMALPVKDLMFIVSY